MKKVFFIISLFAATTVAAQTYEPLPDGDFEQWTAHKTYSGDDYYELEDPFWETLNRLSTLPPDMSTGPVTVYREQGRSGYAPMAKSDTLWVGEDKIFLPGVFGAFTLDVQAKTARFGRPFHSRPDSIVGYMKYAPVNNDSANIFVELYKRIGPVKVTIGKADKIFRNTISEWTRFSIPIDYVIEEEAPDSATVLFIASADIKNFTDLYNCNGQTGSAIWVDECRFIYNNAPSSIETSVKATTAIVYPNPTSGDVSIKLNSPVRNGAVEVLDIRGRVVFAKEFSGTSTSIDLRSLKPALYMYRIVSGGKTLESGRINLVK
ncbi:MAG: PCMD domain-containing protein [Bacteroidales bacterium]|jgi:hypothetical protein|nr:PCMD domain-containing protein [Bacteroidales bacterium]